MGYAVRVAEAARRAAEWFFSHKLDVVLIAAVVGFTAYMIFSKAHGG